MQKLIVNDSIKINHPLANKMSVQNSSYHYATDNTSEVAFFIGNKFQTKVIEEFADYCEGEIGADTLVYSYVPNELVESFLNKYRA